MNSQIHVSVLVTWPRSSAGSCTPSHTRLCACSLIWRGDLVHKASIYCFLSNQVVRGDMWNSFQKYHSQDATLNCAGMGKKFVPLPLVPLPLGRLQPLHRVPWICVCFIAGTDPREPSGPNWGHVAQGRALDVTYWLHPSTAPLFGPACPPAHPREMPWTEMDTFYRQSICCTAKLQPHRMDHTAPSIQI